MALNLPNFWHVWLLNHRLVPHTCLQQIEPLRCAYRRGPPFPFSLSLFFSLFFPPKQHWGYEMKVKSPALPDRTEFPDRCPSECQFCDMGANSLYGKGRLMDTQVWGKIVNQRF